MRNLPGGTKLHAIKKSFNSCSFSTFLGISLYTVWGIYPAQQQAKQWNLQLVLISALLGCQARESHVIKLDYQNKI